MMGMAAATIVPMTPAHLDAVTALEARAGTNGWTRRMFADDLDRADRVALVAQEPDGPLVAVVVVMLLIDEAHVSNVVVAPERRRAGHARALLRQALAAAGAAGAVVATLEVRESNDGARRLYEQLGFADVGRRRGYYTDPPEDAVIMRTSGWPEELTCSS